MQGCTFGIEPHSASYSLAMQAADKFPDIDNYSGHWPVTDIIKFRLKSTSSQHRKVARKVVVGKSGNKESGKKKSKVGPTSSHHPFTAHRLHQNT
jgi:hypothetical protein